MTPTINVTVLMLAFLFHLLSGYSGGQSKASINVKQGEKKIDGFAVVELFTSEGCSSCPPADVLLAEIVTNAREDRVPVFALSFHVDYWNSLGWKDPYSDHRFSERQQHYAAVLGKNTIYTPQAVINGKVECVGSDESKLQSVIAHELTQKAAFSLNLKHHWSAKKRLLNVSYQLAKKSDNAVLSVALVERGLLQHVKRGENRGKTLRHENVVRIFQTRSVRSRASGSVQLKVSENVKIANCSIIAYLQDEATLEMLAAAGVGL